MSRWHRRQFLGISVGSLAVAVLTPWRKLWAAQAHPDLVDVSGSDPATMVQAAVKALGGMGRFVRKGDHVVLKPNAAFANPPDWACTTHPATVAAVAKLCLEAGAKSVTVVEYPQAKADKCLDRCGLTAALAALPEVKIKLLAGKADFKKRQVKGGKVLKEVEVAKAVLSADVLINLPAAKAHNETGVSLGLKNAMGLIYDRKVFHTMFDLHQGVADLGKAIVPQLTIVDATRALLTNGPAGPGETATPGRMVAGTDVVAVDAYALRVARFNNRQMTLADARHIQLAGQDGVGRTDVDALKVHTVKV
ncbi:MAG: DUF362 domain-containing protein [Proteobacteria bacterium]|nr:DUF362 domain-containing protein [Pseudomonadota bacterium]